MSKATLSKYSVVKVPEVRRMKPSGVVSTAALFLLLGGSAAVVASRQEEPPPPEEARPQQEARPPQEARPGEEARPPQREQEARPPQHPEEARPPERAEPGREQAVRPEQRPTPEQRRTIQTAWEGHRAQHWQTEHRDWRERGGYHGYRIPQERCVAYFGPSHVFPIYTVPVVVVGGFPRFQYEKFWFTVVDPWPEY
jgi:hypothetical protein